MVPSSSIAWPRLGEHTADQLAVNGCGNNRLRAGLALPILLIVLLTPPAGAQEDTTYATFWDHPIHVGAVVGESFPTRQWRNSFESGDDGALSLAWPVRPGSSIWLESQFNGQSQLMLNTVQSAFQATGGGASIYSLTFNAVVNKPDLLFGRVTPYIVGGGGAYYRRIELDDYAGTAACSPFLGFCGVYGAATVRTRTQDVFGWDAGGGMRIRLPSFWVVVEARYNRASTRYQPTTFVPVTVGIMW